MGRLGALFIVGLLLVLGRAGFAAVDQTPILVVDTGVHEAEINAVAKLADGAFVTASDDKTARVWSADGADVLAVLRPPIGTGDEGALYAVAASAKVIAVAGRVRAAAGGYGIAFYSTQDYRSLALISGLPSAVLTMKLSAAGDRLAVGLDTGGLRVYDLKSQSLAGEDRDFPGKVTGLDFDASGRLAVAAGDATIRVYDPSVHRLPVVALKPGARAWSVAFSPDGAMLAAGDRGRAAVHIVDMKTTKFARTLEGASGRSGSFNVVTFAADGGSLYAAGSYLDQAGTVLIRRWQGSTWSAADIPASGDLVTSLTPADKGILFTTAEPVIGLVDPANSVRVLQSPRHIDFHDRARTHIALSRDGSVIEITRARGGRLIIDAARRVFVKAAENATDLLPPAQSGSGMTVSDWRDSHTPRVNGRALQMEPAETARSAAVSPAGVAVGTDFFVRFAGANGSGWKVSAGSPVWAVAASQDGRVVVACLADGTIHWYDAASGQELVALFIDPITERLAEWTPAGYFDHDHREDGQPDGRDLIGYRVNDPAGRTSDFVSIGQLYATWFRPDLVGQSFRADSRGRADTGGRTGTVNDTLRGGLPPRVTLLDACAVASADAQTCTGARSISATRGRAGPPPEVNAPALLLRFKVEGQGGDPGRVVPRLNDAVFRSDITVEENNGHVLVEHATIPLARGLNVVRLSSLSANGAIESAAGAGPEIRVMRSVEREGTNLRPDPARPDAAAADLLEPHGKLFVLTVGVGKLPNPAWNLANPANDATALAETLRHDEGRLFNGVNVRLLVDAGAAKSMILSALRDISKQSTPDDVVVLYLAGHGRTVDGQYYFAPSDIGRNDPALMRAVSDAKTDETYDRAVDALFRAEGLGQEELLPFLQDSQATRIAFILDTCYSATLADASSALRHDVNSTVTNRIGHASGRFVLSGSFTEAFDSGGGADARVGEEGHGLFTAYLLRALQGDAGTDTEGRIDIYKLATYTRERVAIASRKILAAAKTGEKTPEVQKPEYYFAGNDFFALRRLQTTKPGR